MLERGFLAPTLNLDEIAVDSRGPFRLREVALRRVSRVTSNNYAFGGINTSLILASPP